MIEIFLPFIKQILSFCGYKITEIPQKYRRELLTALKELTKHQVVMIPGMIELAKSFPGKLLIDDTNNPKFGLKAFAMKLKILSTGANRLGYKIVLFLWQTKNFRIPIGFALCHSQSPTPSQLALMGLSQLRNRFNLVPELVLGDAGYETDDIAKLLKGYGWRFIARCKKSRTIDGQQVWQAIPRGYGQESGCLKNGVKVKIVRRQGFFLLCNRLLMESAQILAFYRNRWDIEDVFRVLKSTIGLDRCKQHSMEAQAIYIILSLLIFTCLELYSADSGQSCYYLHRQVILGHLQVEDLLKPQLFSTA